jgi:hypothetical protein
MNSSIFNSEAGKFIFRVVLPYLAIMAAICFALDGWFARTVIFSVEDEGPSKIHHYFTTDDPAEVPIFGNSRTNHALDPTRIAPHGWNYGVNGSDSELLRLFLTAELGRKRTTPILIGMDPDFFFLNRFGDVMDYVPMAGHPAVWEFLKAQGQSQSYHRLPLLRFYGSFERFLHRYLITRVTRTSYCEASNGASMCNRRLDPDAPLPTIPKDNLPAKPTHYANAFWLYETVQEHQERRFVFVEVPFYYRLLLANNADAQFAILKRHLRALPNVTWVALPDTSLPVHYFENLTHLNADGARWFSDEVRARMHADGILP